MLFMVPLSPPSHAVLFMVPLGPPSHAVLFMVPLGPPGARPMPRALQRPLKY